MRATEPSTKLAKLDTTSASLLHSLARGICGGSLSSGTSSIKVSAAAISVTYLPLLFSALISQLPIARRTTDVHLPFLFDWNVAFMFLVSFPVLLTLTLRDESVLFSSMGRIQTDGVLVVPDSEWDSLCARWKKRFRLLNLTAQALGLVAGGLLSWLNYKTYAPPQVGFWIASHGRLLPVGFVFLWCIAVFYALLPVYVLRNAGISYFLKDLVEHSEINVLPFHPDQSGGLRPVGEIGLRNQYGLTVVGVNVVLLVFVSVQYLQAPQSLYHLMVAAGIAYLVLGPIVFVGPLLPFRGGMLRTKTELMSEVAQRLRIELHRLHEQLLTGQITKDDEELIDRLRKLGSVIDQLPVWPFDFGTLRRFLSAYITPLLGAGVLKTSLAFLVSMLKH